MASEPEKQQVVTFANALQVLCASGPSNVSVEILTIWARIGDAVPQVRSTDALRAVKAILVRCICRYEKTLKRELESHRLAAYVDCIESAASWRDLKHAITDYGSSWKADQEKLLTRPTLDARMSSALSYIDVHLSDNRLSVAAVARHIGLSKWHFEHLLKRQTGESYVGHVRRLRLEKAVCLLRDPQLSVKEVSARIGYSHVSVFNRFFRLQFGMSPSEWRRRALRGTGV